MIGIIPELRLAAFCINLGNPFTFALYVKDTSVNLPDAALHFPTCRCLLLPS
jgi:hypothetical protein